MTIAIWFVTACAHLPSQDPARESVDREVQQFERACQDADKLVLDALARGLRATDSASRMRAETELAIFRSTGALPPLAVDVAAEVERLRRNAFLRVASAFSRAVDAYRAVGRPEAAAEFEERRIAFHDAHDDCLWTDLLVRVHPELGLDSLSGSWKREGLDLVSDANECSSLRLPLPDDVRDYELELEVTRRFGDVAFELVLLVGDAPCSWRIDAAGPDGSPDAPPDDGPAGRRVESIAITVTGAMAHLELNGRPLGECDSKILLAPSAVSGRSNVRAQLTSAVGNVLVLTRARVRSESKPVTARKVSKRSELAEPRVVPKRAEPPEEKSNEPAPDPATVGRSWRGDCLDRTNRWFRLEERTGDVVTFEIEGDYPGERFRVIGKLKGVRVIVDDIECVGRARGRVAASMKRPSGTITFCANGRLSVNLAATMHRKKTTLWSLDCDDAVLQ